MRRPSPIFIISSLLLGAITTPTVAWLAAALHFRMLMRGRSPRSLTVIRDRDPARGEGSGFFQVSEGWNWGSTHWNVSVHGLTGERAKRAVTGSPERRLPSWTFSFGAPFLIGDSSWPGPESAELRRIHAAGWPSYCFYAYQPRSSGAWIPYRGYWSINIPLLTPPDAAVSPLPIRPVWRGLIVNTLVFSLLYGIALQGFAATYRRLRRRPNHCPYCNYNLKGLGLNPKCPECGHQTLCRPSGFSNPRALPPPPSQPPPPL